MATVLDSQQAPTEGLPAVRPPRTLELLVRLVRETPLQPATNLWRAIELSALARALPRRGRCLDVGCGNGMLTGILREVLQADWELIGLDPDEMEAGLATETGIYRTVHCCGADAIPEPPASFDVAVANSVLEHVPNLCESLGEIARCLKPGGRLLATVPSPFFRTGLRGPVMPWRSAAGRQRYLQSLDARLKHLHYWSQAQWQERLRDAGLELETVQGFITRKQLRRWELLSKCTGGLAYRLGGRKHGTMQIQQRLRLRRAVPRWLRPAARPLARLIGGRILEDCSETLDANAGFLVIAIKDS
ncbi:MAG: class I SAM-dependent methyltransferase [Pirellulales bacterium]|nr:class I SAM-dependent methyltransferase [Pirellulales bacterium]